LFDMFFQIVVESCCSSSLHSFI